MNLTAHGSTLARAMCDTLAQLALEMVCKQLAVAVSCHGPEQHGVLYLTTASPRLRHVALHGTFLPPMSGDVGCLKFHNPPTDAALPPHVSGEKSPAVLLEWLSRVDIDEWRRVALAD